MGVKTFIYGGYVLSGDFERKLRRLNKKLHIFCGENENRPAGVWLYKSNGEYEEICGVDKNYVPEHVEYNENGTIRKGGWRRVLRLLVQRRVIDRKHAERVFGAHLPYGPAKRKPPTVNAAEQWNKFSNKYGA